MSASVSGRSTLERIFAPRSIAVVGASADPTKRGHQILRALDESGFQGVVHPVNPRGGTLLGRTVVASVGELPDDVDLAVLCTPASAAPDLVRAAGARGIAGAVVLAVGFGESDDDGRRLERELTGAGLEAGVRIIGPNTSGMLNLDAGVNLVGARGVRAGGIALLVQSGNVALSLMNDLTERSWDGVSIYLGVGNEIDLGFAEALGYVGRHPLTTSIILYVEGLRDPRAFLAAAAAVTRSKPIVAIKSGRTVRGAEAARSHTGAVAGPYARLRAGFAQAGIVEVTRTDELLHVAETLGRQPPCPPGRGIVILSDGGGQGALAADLIDESDAELAVLREDTRTELRALLGPAAAVGNPVDLAGAADADPGVFARAIDVLTADPAVGAILVVGLFGGYAIRFSERLAEVECGAADSIASCAGKAGVGLVVHSMYASHRSAPLDVLGRAGVPVVGSLEVACRCVIELQGRGRFLSRPPWAIGASGAVVEPARADDVPTRANVETAHPIVEAARARGERALSEPDARTLLRSAGLDVDPGRIVASADEASRSVESGPDGRPAAWALKLVSADIVHKTEAGGVVLNVRTPDEARRGFALIADNAAAYRGTHGLDAGVVDVLVTPMLPDPRAELLIGATRDRELGPVLTVGAGGIWVEAIADVAQRVSPVEPADVVEMLDELRIGRVLQAGRGRPTVDPAPIVRVALAVLRCLDSHPDVAAVEINPLFVYPDRVAPVDARVLLALD